MFSFGTLTFSEVNHHLVCTGRWVPTIPDFAYLLTRVPGVGYISIHSRPTCPLARTQSCSATCL